MIERPTMNSKKKVAKKAGISVKEVSRWVKNRRRILRHMKQQNSTEYTTALEKFFMHRDKYVKNTKCQEMEELMKETKLTSIQILKWFANKRRAENISSARYKNRK